MKALFAAVLALAFGAAQAETTITLDPAAATCSGTVCVVHTGTIYGDVVVSRNTNREAVLIDTVSYSGPLANPAVLYAADGSWLTTTIYWTSRVVCGGSGRGGGYCHVLYTFHGGDVVLP